MKWEKFFTDKMKVKLDIVDMSYVTKYHLDESYSIVEGERVPFTIEEINELYNLPNDLNTYPGQRLIVDPMHRDANKIIN